MVLLKKISLLSIFIFFVFPFLMDPILAQNRNQDITIANQLFREGNFKEAYEIFYSLLRQHPGSYTIYEHTVNSLIQLKRYDDAIEISKKRIQRNPEEIQTRVKLGEIFHIAGESTRAFETWEELLTSYPNNMQSWRRVAHIMDERRLYREAIEVYQRANEQFQDPFLFAFNIADNYLAIGDFEPAIGRYLDILENHQQHRNHVQRQLLNYDDARLFDTAIYMSEERLQAVSPASRKDFILRDFLIWLNMERGFYRRALAAARTYDRLSDHKENMLFRIGQQLRTQQEFALAEEAFSVYFNLEDHHMRPHSYEELARTYQDWASYLIDHNLDFAGKADALYQKAFDMVEALTRHFPRYERMMNILVIQSELALDHLKKADDASRYHKKMKQASRMESDEALTRYVEGRILLFEGDFSLARVALTRAVRIAERGELAEKARYYLGLGDFYNSEFTYSRLQLRSLERQNHSYYANDALSLRFMIQQTYDKDGDNEILKKYARGRYLYDTGRYHEAAETLHPLLQQTAITPVQTAAVLLLTKTMRKIEPESALQLLIQYMRLPSVQRAPSERLLWERARLADHLLMMQKETAFLESPDDSSEKISSSDDGKNLSFLKNFSPIPFILTNEMVIEYYEALLMSYPDGFFSTFTRERIRNLEKEPQTT